MVRHGIDLSSEQVQAFCRKWRIYRLAAFGSVLRASFSAESDVDLVAWFDDDARWGVLDAVRMNDEIEALLERPVRLVSARGIETSQNPLMRHAILDTAETVYAA